jgi:hypothetical protein
MQCSNELISLMWGTRRCSPRSLKGSRWTTPPRVLEEEELSSVSEEKELPCMTEEEEEPPVGVEEEEEPSPTSPLSRLMKPPPGAREEERCGSGWSFPPPAYMREEQWCSGGWSFPPRGLCIEPICGLYLWYRMIS